MRSYSAVANRELPVVEREAMNVLGQLVERSAVTIFSSPVAAEEMSRVPAPYFADHIKQYRAVRNVSSDLTWEAYNPATELMDLEKEDPVYEGLRELLPDDFDAQHLAQAKLNGIDNVLTLDARTILRHGPELRDRFGLNVFKPSEFVSSYSSLLSSFP